MKKKSPFLKLEIENKN